MGVDWFYQHFATMWLAEVFASRAAIEFRQPQFFIEK
jgi:hypothetical protein